MAIKIDDYGCKCEISVYGDEFAISMHHLFNGECEVLLTTYVNKEELKSAIKELENEE